MKILPLISPKFKSSQMNALPVNRSNWAANRSAADVFIKSIKQEPNSNIEVVKELENASIVREENDFEKFYFVKDNEVLCWMKMSDNGSCIEVDKLYSNNPQKHEGAGTELLKFAVEKSMEYGYGGKITVCMAGSQPFYRKCNFKLGKSPAEYDPALDAVFDFSARTNGKYPMGWSTRQNMFAFLDEEGAKAFLENKRQFLKPDSKIMARTTLNLNRQDRNAKIDGFIDFCSLGDNKYVAQFLKLDKKESTVIQSAYIMAELVDDDGVPTLQTIESKDFGVPFSCRKYEKEFSEIVHDELMNVLEIQADELGFKLK